MPAQSLKQRILHGAGAQAFTQLFQTFSRLIEVPAFLYVWEPRRYGEWLLVAAIPTYLSLADGGFATTAGREMTMRMGGGDEDGARDVFQSCWALLLGVAAIALLLILPLLLATPVVSWVVSDPNSATDVRDALIILSVYVLAGFMTGLYYGVFCAVQRYALGTWISSSFYPADLVFSLAGAALFGTLTAAATGLLLSRMLLIAVDCLVLRRVAPWCTIGFAHVSGKLLKDLVRPAAGSLAIPLGMAGNVSGMRIMVGLVLGPALVPLFSATRTLARAAQMPTLFIIRILEPELAIAYGQGHMDIFRMLLRRSAQIATWSGVTITILVLIGGQSLFPIWVHHRFKLDTAVLLLLLAASALNGLWYTMLQAAYATNRMHKVAVPFVLIYGLLCIALSWLLMRWMGLAGAAFALLLVELAMCMVALPRALELSHESWANLFRTILSPPGADLLRALRRARTAAED